MASYSVIINGPALNDLESIYRYFAWQLLTPRTASKMVKTIEDEINNYLSFSPHYPIVDDDRLAAKGYRRMNVKKYAVFFVIDEETKTVRVRRIIHGARDWKPILSDET